MRLLLPLSFAALLIAAGCSKDKDVEPPATLVDFPQTLPVKRLWDDGVGGGKKQTKLRLGLGPAIDNGVVFAANHKGEMLAVSLGRGGVYGARSSRCRFPRDPRQLSASSWPAPARARSLRWTAQPGANCGARKSILSCFPR